MTDPRDLEQRVQELESELARMRGSRLRGIRRKAGFELFGLPAYAIALGPDPATGEMRGHARGFLAIGDLATGVIAIGGLARGLVALGGLAIGGITFGGRSLGLGLALGGAAIGGVALGGGALGGVAMGGASCGVYAVGGAVAGKHVVGPGRRDPEAERFFTSWGVPLPRGRSR